MAYKIYDYDAAGNETYRCTADSMDEMFPDRDDPERIDVEGILARDRRCWVAGLLGCQHPRGAGHMKNSVTPQDRLADECHGYDLDGNPVTARRYTVTIDVDVLDPAKVIAAARDYYEGQEEGLGELVVGVEDALRVLFDAKVEPTDCGFEVVDSNADLAD